MGKERAAQGHSLHQPPFFFVLWLFFYVSFKEHHKGVNIAIVGSW
jgi:hypothetical protein